MYITFRAMNDIFKQFDLIKSLASSIRALQTEIGFSHNEIDIYFMQVLNANRPSNKDTKCQDWIKLSLKEGCQRQEFLQSIIKSLQYQLSVVSRSCIDIPHLQSQQVQQKLKLMNPEVSSKRIPSQISAALNPFKLKGEAKQRNRFSFYSYSDPDINPKKPSLFDQISSSNDHTHQNEEAIDLSIKQTIQRDEIGSKYLLTRYEELASLHGIAQNDKQFQKLQRISKFYREFMNMDDKQERQAGDFFSQIDYYLSIIGK